MKTTILDLCAGLPATEGELRERAVEFNQAVATNVLNYSLVDDGDYWKEPNGPRYSVDDIDFIVKSADSKKAIDALLKRHLRFSLNWNGIEWEAELYWARNAALDGLIEVTATASTMQLAMSACALLAASARSQPQSRQ